MAKRAILIGINYFGTQSELAGCINDIVNVHKLIKTKFSEIVVLHDGPVENYATLGKNVVKPTCQNIKQSLISLVEKSATGDMIYIHYSGHGSGLADNNGDEKDAQDECLVPVDYNYDLPDCNMIRDDWLRLTLCEKKKGLKIRGMFDCCHSGSICDLPYMYSNRSKCYDESKALEGDYVTISGCKDSQTSADSADETGTPAGAMTWAFLKAIKDINKVTAKNKKIKYTWADLTELMRFTLKANGYDQIPQLCVSNKLAIKSHMDLLI